jgi:hypothetical protein
MRLLPSWDVGIKAHTTPTPPVDTLAGNNQIGCTIWSFVMLCGPLVTKYMTSPLDTAGISRAAWRDTLQLKSDDLSQTEWLVERTRKYASSVGLAMVFEERLLGLRSASSAAASTSSDALSPVPRSPASSALAPAPSSTIAASTVGSSGPSFNFSTMSNVVETLTETISMLDGNPLPMVRVEMYDQDSEDDWATEHTALSHDYEFLRFHLDPDMRPLRSERERYLVEPTGWRMSKRNEFRGWKKDHVFYQLENDYLDYTTTSFDFKLLGSSGGKVTARLSEGCDIWVSYDLGVTLAFNQYVHLAKNQASGEHLLRLPINLRAEGNKNVRTHQDVRIWRYQPFDQP